jgi:hypothetical protein
MLLISDGDNLNIPNVVPPSNRYTPIHSVRPAQVFTDLKFWRGQQSLSEGLHSSLPTWMWMYKLNIKLPFQIYNPYLQGEILHSTQRHYLPHLRSWQTSQPRSQKVKLYSQPRLQFFIPTNLSSFRPSPHCRNRWNWSLKD